MKKGKKIAVWTIGVISGIAILLAVLYHIPIHRHVDVTMYDDGGGIPPICRWN